MHQSTLIALSFALTSTLTPAAHADVPRVVTDIAPVHSLVAQVMGDLGTPTLLVDGNASPHSFALRPSQAAALEQAQAVFWVGEGLTPWLPSLLTSLAPDAAHVELLESAGTTLLSFREGATFEAHEHGEEHEEHAHDDGHDEDHEGEHEDDHDDHKDDHGDAHDEHDDHDGIDPHAWLDPENGKAWLVAIADQLSLLDPEHKAIFQANAQASALEIDAASAQARAILEPVKGLSFVVFHDAYHYFEARFDIEAAGAISISDAAKPGPARIDEIQHLVHEKAVTCAFSEPQFSDRLVATVLDGTDAHIATLDPLGAHLAPGSKQYNALIVGLAEAIAGC